jgi:integrase/recombinase XerC
MNTIERPTIAEYLSHLSLRQSKRTCAMYTEKLKTYYKFLDVAGREILPLTYQTVVEYITYLKNEKHWCNSVLNDCISALSNFYNYLKILDLASDEDIKNLRKMKKFKLEKKIRDRLTSQEVEDLIYTSTAYVNHISPTKLKAFIYLLCYTGIRRKEFLQIKRKDFNFDLGVVKIVGTREDDYYCQPTKSKKERFIPLIKNLKQVLIDYFNEEPETGEGNAFNMNDGALQYLWRGIRQFVPEGRKISMHSCRHTMGYFMAENDVNIKIAKEIFGHSNIATTEIYYEPSIESTIKVFNEKIKIDKKIKPINKFEGRKD